ncbi:MAG TPA: PQQ-dependent sugar dehydrogenase [Ferruginibacter sp.]|nr:PQQ-dependent sugar dehydrogenase [Ferruginibacter sp.]
MHVRKDLKKNMVAALFVFSAIPCLSSLAVFSQPAPVLVFTPVVSSGLSNRSLDISSAGDGTNRLFITGLEGTVRIVSNGTVLPTPFLDISEATGTDTIHTPFPGSERGFTSLAFHPGYNGTTNRYFFISYCINTVPDNIPCIRITRFQTVVGNPNLADQSTGVVILNIEEPEGDHNAAQLIFGPDGHLYFGVGDGGGSNDPSNQAQNGNSLLGKMLRINVDNFTTPPYYTIPATNPYVNDPNVRDEIFTIGFRNPWRWSFDRLNNDMWIGDVGEGTWEEVNYSPFATAAGINYGWRCYEGSEAHITGGCLPQSNYTSPLFAYAHNVTTGGNCITGGYVYRAGEFPAMYGYYICSDFISGNAWLIKPNGSGGWNVTRQNFVTGGGLPKFITSFGEDEFGVLYAVSYSGTLYKVTTTTQAPVPVTMLQFNAKAFTGYNELKWKTTNEQNLSHYEIEFSSDGMNYIIAGRTNAMNSPVENNYSFRHLLSSFTKLFYRIKSIDKDGSNTYSNVIALDSKERTDIKVYPTLITGNHLNIISAKPVDQVSFFSADGKNVFQTKLNDLSGTISISIPRIPKGLYIVRVKLKDEYVYEKVLIQQE